MRIRLVVVMAAVLALVGCQGERASVTGGYGVAVVSGQVLMADGGSPAGVSVMVRGSSLATVLAADGRFAFAGAPDGGELVFERAADGIAASLRLEEASSSLVIELAKNSATKKSSKRRSGRGGSGVAVTELEGVVRSATATSLVVFTSKQVEQTIALDAATIIRKGNRTLTAADLTAGTRVHVKAKSVEGGGFLATLVIVQNDGSDDDDSPEGREYEGVAVSATATQLVIRDQRNGEVTFVLLPATDIRKGNTPVAAAEILAGSRVHVKATTSADGATRTATRVIVQNNNGGGDDQNEVKLSGTVASIAGTTLSVTTATGTVSVQTAASTRIEKRKSAIALTDLVAGDKVRIEGTRVDATTVLAREIEVK